jgi:NAD(P)-dependent dehydrogenase (short-subunit alcohol dehydrogenase family)
MSEPLRAITSGGDSTSASALASALEAPSAHIRAAGILEGAPLDADIAEHGLAWVHLVPSCDPATCAQDAFAEAALLRRAARYADAVATAAGVSLTFTAVLPSPGMHVGPAGVACDLALTAMRSLMRTEIGSWSSPERRIVGIVRGGVEGYEPAGQRPLEQVRRRTPMASLATFRQLAGAVRYVSSPRASFVTGTFLRVDGGWDAYSWVYPTRTV